MVETRAVLLGASATQWAVYVLHLFFKKTIYNKKILFGFNKLLGILRPSRSRSRMREPVKLTSVKQWNQNLKLMN
jgi:hypothetical protein